MSQKKQVKSTVLPVRMTPDLYEATVEAAKKLNITAAELVRQLIQEHINKQE